MFDWLRRVWGRRQELSTLEGEPIRLLPASVPADVLISDPAGIPDDSDPDGRGQPRSSPDNDRPGRLDAPLPTMPRQHGMPETIPEAITLAPSTEDHGPELLPPLPPSRSSPITNPQSPIQPTQIEPTGGLAQAGRTIILPSPESLRGVQLAPQEIEEKLSNGVARETSYPPAREPTTFAGRTVIITPPPGREPALPDVTASSSTNTPEPTAVKSLLEWRDSSYFELGAYASRWGMEATLCLPSGSPALRSQTSAWAVRTMQVPPPAAAERKKAGVFSFLATATRDSHGNGFRVDPATLTEFLLTREEEVASEAGLYWTDALLLTRTQAVMRGLLARRDEGLAPITPQEMLEIASVGGADATALLVCHNVARAFARGSTALQWRATDPARGLYRNGDQTIRAARIREPIFYEVFNSESLLALDPGDWYRFFGAAAATAFAAGETLSPVRPADPPPLVEAVDRIARQILALGSGSEGDDCEAPGSGLAEFNHAAAALAWVNAMQFWERGLFCPSEEAIRRSAAQGLRGFRLGLECAGIQARKRWTWQLPKPLGLDQELQRVDATRVILRILGEENSVAAI